MAEEYERFEITDYDLENEFNPNRRRKNQSKHQQIYGKINVSKKITQFSKFLNFSGIWADDSEDDNSPDTKSSRKKGYKDYSAPVSFIAGEIHQPGKKKQEKSDESDQEDTKIGFGFAGRKVSSDSSEEETPVQKPQEMAGMRRAYQPSLSNKGLGEWEQHTKGIGAKLLLQMGYQPGKGLGKELQGINAPVEAHVRKGRGAIGAYGPEKKTKVAELKIPKQKAVDRKMDPEDKEDKKQWTKKSHKGRYFYKSVDDVIEKGKKTDYMLYNNTKNMSKVTVIDMTGPEKRVLSGYHALGQAKVEDGEIYESKATKELKNFQLPELMHNLNLIVEMCEQEIISIDKKQRMAEDKQKSLTDEKEHLEKIVTLERDYIETLEGASDLVDKLVTSNESLTLEETEKIFLELKIDYKNEFEEFSLGDLVPGIIAPKMAELMSDWKPLEDQTKHVELLKKWAGILGYHKTQVTTAFDPYPALIWSTIVPCFRRATNEWNPRVHQPMAALLDAWSELLPDWMLDNILEQIVLAKLTQEVNLWDPLTDTIPIHIWILPWSGILGAKMENNVYKIICGKLSCALRAWNPEDRSARAMITPWKNVWAEEDLQMFLHKNIVPKLEMRLAEFIVNPLQQDLELFNQVWEWNELLAPQIMAQILDKYFFPQWIQTLVLWLNQSPNFDEVSRWYSGWKGLLNETILKQANVKEHFRKALELMQRSTGVIMSETTATSAPAQPQKPPSLLDLNIAPPIGIQLEFKEMVSQKCAERGIIFVPVPGKREKGKQVYRTGKLFCYIDRSVCIVSSDGGNSWSPISLNAMLEKAVTG